MPFTIVVDGPNFINDLHRHGKNKDYIMNTLSFPTLHGVIQRELGENGLYSHPFYHTEFICSNKPQIGELIEPERSELLHKLKHERGVIVKQVDLSSEHGQEKAVDMFVFSRMLQMGGSNDNKHVVLIASDKDYVPAVEALMSRGIHVIVVGFNDGEYPEQLINESYLFIDMQKLLNEMEDEIKKSQKI
ncbi:MAG: NYN domain-containing protein [Candidatus Bathyarchaeota archaeon]|nr:NYN domain-containing protein [Candidatus Bathyarchaeota archaeon]